MPMLGAVATMATLVVTKDCTALSDADLAEMAELCGGSGRAFEIGTLSKQAEAWVLVTMARNECGYHLGTWVAEDGGLIVHAVEGCGVVADTLATLGAVGWRRFRFHLPVRA